MNPPKLKHGLQLAPLGHFSDPNRLVELAALAAIATATSSLRIGTLVTPIVRRRSCL